MNQTSPQASTLTWPHLEAPGLVLRHRTTATSGFLGLAGRQPWMSQVANQRAVTCSLCLCQLFFPKTPQQPACYPQSQQSRAGRGGAAMGLGRGAVPPAGLGPRGTLSPWSPWKLHTSSSLSPFLFHTQYDTGRSQHSDSVSRNVSLRATDNGESADPSELGTTLPVFLRFPARPEGPALEHSRITAASELPLSPCCGANGESLEQPA